MNRLRLRQRQRQRRQVGRRVQRCQSESVLWRPSESDCGAASRAEYEAANAGSKSSLSALNKKNGGVNLATLHANCYLLFVPIVQKTRNTLIRAISRFFPRFGSHFKSLRINPVLYVQPLFYYYHHQTHFFVTVQIGFPNLRCRLALQRKVGPMK